MDPGLSLINPAGDLNLDAINIINDHEEDEAAEDAQIKKKELNALLQNAFDDLIEESSDSDGESMRSETPENNHLNGLQQHTNGEVQDDNVQTSTPLHQNGAPALKTPNYDLQMNPKYSNFRYDGLQDHNDMNGHAEVNALPNGGSHDQLHVGYSDSQHNYLIAGGVQAGQNNVEQLQILNNVKDRQIERLNEQMHELQESLQQQIRILNHQLSLSDVEKNTLASQLEDANFKISENEQKNVQLKADVKSQQLQVKLLKESNHEMEQENKILQKTIDNLEGEMKALQMCDNLTKLREQHENVIKSIQERHQKELNASNLKIDQVKLELETKNDELALMLSKLEEAQHQVDQVNLKKSETINKLTRSLEDSQKQCKDLLDSDTNQQLIHLRVELKKSKATNEITEKLVSSYQDEINKLKEEMVAYEKNANVSNCTSFTDNTMSELLANSKGSIHRHNTSDSKLISLLKEKLKEYISKNAEYENRIQQMKQQMDDQITNNNRCTEECVKRYETNIDIIKQRERENYDESIRKIKAEYEKNMSDVEKQVSQHLNANDELKKLYINICEEKAALVTELKIATENTNTKNSPSKTMFEIQMKAELQNMIAQKNLLQDEVRSLKSKYAAELEALEEKHMQDLNIAVHKVEEERRAEHAKVICEIERKTGEDHDGLMREQKALLDKYHAARSEKEMLEKKVAQLDAIVVQVQETFQQKLQEFSSSQGQNSQPDEDNSKFQAKIEELKLKVKKCQKYAITAEKNAHGEVVKLKTEFTMVVENMRDKMNDLIKSHQDELGKLKQEHKSEIDKLERENKKNLNGCHGDKNVALIKSAYVDTLNCIKNEVVKYIRDFNDRSDQRMKHNLKRLAMQLDVDMAGSEDSYPSSFKSAALSHFNL